MQLSFPLEYNCVTQFIDKDTIHAIGQCDKEIVELVCRRQDLEIGRMDQDISKAPFHDFISVESKQVKIIVATTENMCCCQYYCILYPVRVVTSRHTRFVLNGGSCSRFNNFSNLRQDGLVLFVHRIGFIVLHFSKTT